MIVNTEDAELKWYALLAVFYYFYIVFYILCQQMRA